MFRSSCFGNFYSLLMHLLSKRLAGVGGFSEKWNCQCNSPIIALVLFAGTDLRSGIRRKFFRTEGKFMQLVSYPVDKFIIFLLHCKIKIGITAKIKPLYRRLRKGHPFSGDLKFFNGMFSALNCSFYFIQELK
jgi:hypothetical protein